MTDSRYPPAMKRVIPLKQLCGSWDIEKFYKNVTKDGITERIYKMLISKTLVLLVYGAV